jgi:hypothetical protein
MHKDDQGWMELCQQIAHEQVPEKLKKLIAEA